MIRELIYNRVQLSRARYREFLHAGATVQTVQIEDVAAKAPESVAPRDTVLVITQHALVVGLLTILIEKSGRQFAAPNHLEPPDDAVARIRPRAVLLDYEHASARTEYFYTYAAATGATVLLFSHAHYVDEVKRMGAGHKVRNFVLPVERTAFAQMLAEATKGK